jgi:hypothetical protein
MRSAFQLKHGLNRPANTGVNQRVRAAAAWLHLCALTAADSAVFWLTG